MMIQVYHKNQLEAEALAYLLIEYGYRATPRSGSISKRVTNGARGMPKPKILLIDTSSLRRFSEIDLNFIETPTRRSALLGRLRDLHHLFRHSVRNPGFISKRVTVSELLESIDRLSEYRGYLSPRVLNFFQMSHLDQQRTLISETLEVPISKTELAVLAEVGRGKTTNQIAGENFRSPHTINNHRKNAMAKLGISGTFSLGLYTQVKLDEILTLIAVHENKARIQRLLEKEY